MYVMSERVPPGCSACTVTVEIDGTYNMFVSGSHDAPCQRAEPWFAGACSVPRSSAVATDGGVNSGPIR
jgi:hypothetical protein